MKFCLVLICVVASALSVPTERALQEWDTFKATHKKLFRDAAEETFRQRLFLEELQRVDVHNEKYKKGLVSYETGINQFSDWTREEKKQLTGCYIKSEELPLRNITEYVIPDGYVAPERFDWREKGVVGGVRNQHYPHHCGSCWAHATVGALESQWAMKKGQLLDLSEQQLVDCDRDSGDNGCDGGWPEKAFTYIINNNGIATEGSYPYEASDNGCRYKPEMRGATMQDYGTIGKGDEEAMKAALVQKGPLAIAFHATADLFYRYKGGIFYDASCPTILNHAVTLVGYGTENDQDYWLVKNSWGANWGEGGYFRIARNKNNTCGIANDVHYPVV